MEFPKEGTFLDYEGKERYFRYRVLETAVGYTVHAVEKIDNGYEFTCYAPTNPFDALGELRSKIEVGLSTRYLHKKDNKFKFSHDKAVGNISFDQFAEMLQVYEGFSFELKISD